MTAAYDLRTALLRNGYTPLPCDRETKRPVVAGWPDIAVTPELVDSWDEQFPRAQNTGLRLTAIDIDISDAEVCADLESEITDWVDGHGAVLVRFGRPPRRLVPIRIEGELTKVSHRFKDRAGNEQGIELLGSRSQFIAYGTHPAGHIYSWVCDRSPLTVPAQELPQLQATEATALLSHLCEVLVERHGYAAVSRAGNGHAAGTSDDDRIPVDAEAELEAMTPGTVNDVHTRVIPSLLWRGLDPNDVVDQVVAATMAMAAHHGLTEWTKQEETRKHVRPRVSSTLQNLFMKDYNPATGTIPSWLCPEFHRQWIDILAAGKEARWGSGLHDKIFLRAYDPVVPKDPTPKEPGDKKQPSPPKRGPLVIRPFVPFDPATLPPRQWLYGKHYLRRAVSCTTAPGGFGKSSLVMVENIAMATGRNLLGEQPLERLRVWLHNGEDSLDEMMRRLAAICQHYNIPQQELTSWLFMTSGNEFPLRVAEGYNKLDINEALIKCISNQIEDNEIDVVSLDPLITLHGVPESDNTRMDGVMRIFGGISDAHDCSLHVSHHMRKPANGTNGDYGAADIRGASAIHDAVRSARVLNRMSERDALDLSIQEYDRAKYFRVDRAKGNYSPSGKAVWRQFVNVELPNGDDVGVVAPWDYPGQGEGTPEREELARAARHVFQQFIGRCARQSENVSTSKQGNYAPRICAQEPEAKMAKLNVVLLEHAMRQLLREGAIRLEPTGRKGVHRIVPTEPATC